MDFLALQNETLSDRFAEAKRPNVKTWINYRYGRLWGMENWTFKLQVTDLNVSSGASSVARGTIGQILSVWDSTTSPYFSPEMPIRPEELYESKTLTSGVPYNFTVIEDNIVFDRPMSSARTFKVVNEMKFTSLAADADTPLIPIEYHLVLSSGAASHGLRLENDPSWESFEEEWTKGIEDMKKNYLTDVRVYASALPSWP